MPTRAGWGLVIAAAITMIAARAFALTELFVLATTAIALLAASWVLVAHRRPEVDVHRLISPHRIPLGGQCRIELRVSNPGRRRTPVITLHEPIAGTVGAQVSIPPLTPGEVQSATYRLPTRRRGRMPVGPLSMSRCDPFGLVDHTSEVIDQVAVTVLPAIELLGPLGSGGGVDDPLAGPSHAALGLSGDEDLAGLRDYVVGDDLRRVHWASSARKGDLVVREDDPPWRGHVTVALDTRADRMDANRFEDAVSAAASVLHGLSERSDRVRLMFTDGTDTGLVDAATGQHLLLEHLALVTQHPTEARLDLRPPSAGAPGSLVVITGDAAGAPAAAEDLDLFTEATAHFSMTRVVVFSSTDPPMTPLVSPISNPPGGRSPLRMLHVPTGTSFGAVWRASFQPAPASGGPR